MSCFCFVHDIHVVSWFSWIKVHTSVWSWWKWNLKWSYAWTESCVRGAHIEGEDLMIKNAMHVSLQGQAQWCCCIVPWMFLAVQLELVPCIQCVVASSMALRKKRRREDLCLFSHVWSVYEPEPVTVCMVHWHKSYLSKCWMCCFYEPTRLKKNVQCVASFRLAEGELFIVCVLCGVVIYWVLVIVLLILTDWNLITRKVSPVLRSVCTPLRLCFFRYLSFRLDCVSSNVKELWVPLWDVIEPHCDILSLLFFLN